MAKELGAWEALTELQSEQPASHFRGKGWGWLGIMILTFSSCATCTVITTGIIRLIQTVGR